MRPRGRLRRLRTDTVLASAAATGHARRRSGYLWPVGAGAGAAALFAHTVFAAVITGVLVGAGAALVLRIWPGEARARTREAARHAVELPFALDIAAAGLRAGLPVTGAFDCAARACESGLGQALASFSQALRLGASAEQAGSWLERVSTAERVVTTVGRSIHSGAMLADSVELLACELREEQEVAAQVAAQRAGVWMVLPLCLCFLPAFVAAGLVPVVLSTLDDVLQAY